MIGALPMPASQNSFEDAMAVGKELLFGAKQRSSMIAEAERCFRRALEFMPQSADAMAHIARALDDQGRWTESKDWYERHWPSILPMRWRANDTLWRYERLVCISVKIDRDLRDSRNRSTKCPILRPRSGATASAMSTVGRSLLHPRQKSLL
jgi:hypothetical protein